MLIPSSTANVLERHTNMINIDDNTKYVYDFRILFAEAVEGGENISKMGPREREEGGFGDLQPVMKKLKLGGDGEKREIEGEEEMLKGEGRGVKRRHHPDTECTGACVKQF